MMARVFGILCYGAAGFFTFAVALIGFEVTPSAGIILVIMLGFSVPAAMALVAGFACDGFCNKRRAMGIVLLSAAGFESVTIGIFSCVLAVPELRKMAAPETIAQFSDFRTGFGFLLLMVAIGLISLRSALRRPKLFPGATLLPRTPHVGHEPQVR
jgi:hypothetical protein